MQVTRGSVHLLRSFIDAAPVATQADGDDVVSTPAVSTPAVAAEMAAPPSPVAVKGTGQKAKRRDDGTRREADPSNSPLTPTHSPDHRSGGTRPGEGAETRTPHPNPLPSKARGEGTGLIRRGSPDPAETADRRSPASASPAKTEEETCGPVTVRGRETRAQQLAAVWVVAALLLAPLGVSGPVPGAPSPLSLGGLPMVHSGDEPHYLVLINSVISDGDIDVANNYADVHAGGLQAGRKFAGWAIDHHVNWYWHEHLIHWWQAYENDYTKWNKDADGHPVPTLRADSIHRPVNVREYSQHAPGLAWLIPPIVWPFRGTSLVEPLVLLCSALATVAGLLAFCRLVRPYAGSDWQVVLVAVVAYLGSPLWHYGRTLYVEPFLALLCVAAYAAVLRYDRYLVAGLCIGAGVLLKVPFAVIAVPLIGEALWRKRWQEAASCAAPIVIAGALLLWCNYRTHGGWLLFPQKWEWGLPLFGVAGLAFSWKHGLILFSPVVLVSLLGVREWFRRQPREATLITTATVLYGLVMASWAQWWGGTCYSARLIVPVVPFLFAPLCSLVDSKWWTSDWRLRATTWTLAVVSILFGMIGAFSCEHVWDKHPLQIALKR